MSMSIVLSTTALLRIKLDQRINPHDGHTSLDSRFELLHLTHTRLQYARLHTIMHTTFREIKTIILVPLRLGQSFRVGPAVLRRRWTLRRLRRAVRLLRLVGHGSGFGGALAEGVAGAELGDEFAAVFCCVDGEGGGDNEEGSGEGANG